MILKFSYTTRFLSLLKLLVQSKGYFHLHEPIFALSHHDHLHLEYLAFFFVKVQTFDGFLVCNMSHGVHYT